MRDLSWKKVDSKYIIKDTWATVRADVCLRQDGKIIEPYYVYEFPDWVTAFAITNEGKVIVERQFRYALGQTHFEMPGGCVDESDATLQDAIARELIEETGYAFENYEFLGSSSANPSTNANLMHFYLATGGKKIAEQNFDEGEDIEVYLMSIEEVIELVKTDKIIQAMHQELIMKALLRLGRMKYL
ncbi:MAG: NUDIX hydrolase [Chitinophagaceae bacterium]